MAKQINAKTMLLVMVAVIVIAMIIALAVMVIMVPRPPGQVCGNGECEVGEDYTTCPSDCDPPPSSDQSIMVVPSTQTVDAGDDVDVDIYIYSAADLFGFQLNMGYDPAILEFKENSEGSFLDEGGSADTFYMPPDTSVQGLVKNIVCARKGQIGGVDGDGILATVTFSAISSGTSDLTISNVMLSDSLITETQSTVSNGEVVVR